MFYCRKRQKYVERDEECKNCIFYDYDTDSCWYEDWYPGLIQKDKE